MSDVLAVTDSKTAEMFVVPRFLAVTNPLAVTEAMDGNCELQVATPVMSCFVLSEKVAVAVNCWLTSSGRLELMGATAIETGVAEVTVNDAVLEMDPELAVIVTVPAERPVVSPLVGTLLLTVATAVFEELQDTLEVMFLVVLSL